jgi:hypothetical protein
MDHVAGSKVKRARQMRRRDVDREACHEFQHDVPPGNRQARARQGDPAHAAIALAGAWG